MWYIYTYALTYTYAYAYIYAYSLATETDHGESDGAIDAAKVPLGPRAQLTAKITSLACRSTAHALETAADKKSVFRYGASSIYTCMCTCIGARVCKLICA